MPFPPCPDCGGNALQLNPTPLHASGPKMECGGCGWYTVGEYGSDDTDAVTYLFDPKAFRKIRKRGDQRHERTERDHWLA